MNKEKHCCQQNAFLATNVPSKVDKSAVPSDHLRSEILSLTLATSRKQGDAI